MFFFTSKFQTQALIQSETNYEAEAHPLFEEIRK